MPNKSEKIEINTEFIRLDSALKFTGSVQTGGEAKLIIQDGKVKVNGEPCTMRTKKLRPGNSFEYEGQTYIISGVQ